MNEIQKQAEIAAQWHFQDGRDAYEEISAEIVRCVHSPVPGLTVEQSIGAFIMGIAKNNFYYGYYAARKDTASEEEKL